MPHSTTTAAHTAPSSDILSQITTSLISTHSLPISPTWLQANLPSFALSSTTTSSSPPLPSLLKTILFRLLNSDFTASLTAPAPPTTTRTTTTATTHTFPPQPTLTPQTQTLVLPPTAKIPAQILDIVDIGASLSVQLESLESVARGEGRRGREIVRIVDVEGAGNHAGGGGGGARGGTTAGAAGPFKVLLSDMKGIKVWGFTVAAIDGIGMPMPLLTGQQQQQPGDDPAGGGAGGGTGNQAMAIGCKVLLHSEPVVWRGIVLLKPENCKVLGGKIEALDRAWREGRMERLKEEIRRIKEGGDAAR